MVALDPVVRVLPGVVEHGGQQLLDHVLERLDPVGHHLVWFAMGANRSGEEPVGCQNVASLRDVDRSPFGRQGLTSLVVDKTTRPYDLSLRLTWAFTPAGARHATKMPQRCSAPVCHGACHNLRDKGVRSTAREAFLASDSRPADPHLWWSTCQQKRISPASRIRFGSGRPDAPIVPSGLRYWWTSATRSNPSKYQIIWLNVPGGCPDAGGAGCADSTD